MSVYRETTTLYQPYSPHSRWTPAPVVGEILLEELLQLVLPEPDGEGGGEGVEEAGQAAGHLPLPLAEAGHGVEEVAVRTAEGSGGGQSARPHLPAHPELPAAAGDGEVAREGAGVGGAGGHGVVGGRYLTI